MQAGASSTPAVPGAPGFRRRGRRSAALQETLIRRIFFLCALVSILTTVGILFTLLTEAVGFFIDAADLGVYFWDFLVGSNWAPRAPDQYQSFGVLPLVMGTLLVTVVAAAVALPVGLFTAIFLAEYAPDRVRRTIKPILEILAGVPTVVYGYFALTFVAPIIQTVIESVFNHYLIVFNALSAGLVLGLMIVPMVSSLSEDAMLAVPRSLREGAYALGATRIQVSLRVVVPAALSGIVAAFILAISRAIGETMLVTIAAGATPKMTFNPLESIQTMTAYIVQASLGEAVHGSLEFRTIFAVGTLLFMMTFAMNLLGHFVVRRWREHY